MRTIAVAIGDALRDLGAMFAIVFLCIGAAILYGICHDQITARICIEYFSIFHPTDILPAGMNPNSPTEQGFFWGVIATWWMGVFIGVPLSIVARVGTAKPLDVSNLIRPVGILLIGMGLCALLAGCVGYVLSEDGTLFRYLFPRFVARIPESHWRGFVADYFAHTSSYFVGAFGGFVLLLYSATIRWRRIRTAL